MILNLKSFKLQYNSKIANVIFLKFQNCKDLEYEDFKFKIINHQDF